MTPEICVSNVINLQLTDNAMNTKISIFILTVSLLFGQTTQAAQQKIQAARDKLNDALRHVIKSGTETPKKHLDTASTCLAMAKSHLENAAPNKGSHTHVAIEKIDAATKEVQATLKSDSHREPAIEAIKSAIKEVNEAGRAGAK
jgi:putative cell wall-binding protein